MKVLAIDPGYDRVGIAVLELVNGREVLHHSTCLETDRTQTLHERIQAVGEVVTQTITTHETDTLAIETLFFNKNVKTAMDVAQARGVVIFSAQCAGCDLYEFSPQEVKIAVTGHGNSDKTAVTAMVQQLVPSAPPDALDDEYDAIAVGIACLATYGRSR